MCRIMEEFAEEERAEARAEERTKTALEMIKDGTLSLEKIAQYSHLPLETVKHLAEQKDEVQV